MAQELDKHTFKVCEAVALGLTHYYMGPRDKRKVTKEDKLLAKYVIPTLPDGWMQKSYKWQLSFKKKQKKQRSKKND